MDASQALADLIEISTQIQTAVLLDTDGKVVASAGTDPAKGEAIARSARQLLAAAEETMGGTEAREKLVQLQAATAEGSVFVMQDEGRVVAAVTAPDPTVGLVFYDLKTCLRHAAGEDLAPKPNSRTAANGAENGPG